jgi:hypothetical protein
LASLSALAFFIFYLEINFVETQNCARWGLALAHLYAGNLPAARTAAETARKYIEVDDFFEILDHTILLPKSHGKLGADIAQELGASETMAHAICVITKLIALPEKRN